jgi:antitoxin component of MazEF toxin-antitoxin module
MKQLHEVAEKYRTMKRLNAKLSKWGVSLGVRIPKELVERYKLKDKTEVTFIPEDGSIRIIV